MRHLLLFLHLIFVHGPGGQEIQLNTAEISTIRQPSKSGEGHFGPGTRCVLAMNNGRYIPTTETCEEIVKQIREEEKEKP